MDQYESLSHTKWDNRLILCDTMPVTLGESGYEEGSFWGACLFQVHIPVRVARPINRLHDFVKKGESMARRKHSILGD